MNVLFLADRASLVQLIFLAIVAGLTLKHLACRESVFYGMTAGGIVLATYFLHCFSLNATFDMLAAAFLRSLCVSHIAMCATCVGVTVWMRVYAKVQAMQYRAEEMRRHKERLEWQERERAERARPRPSPPPPPPSPKEKAQAFARDAQAEYDAEIELLKSLPLDRDEFEVLEMQAKRKLLRKLRDRK